jgi:hypothetical protein
MELGHRTLIVSIAEPNPVKQKPGIARESTPSSNTKSYRHVESTSPATSSGSPAPTSGPSFDEIKKKTLGVMNVSDTVNDTKIRQMFEKYGPLRKVTLRPDHQWLTPGGLRWRLMEASLPGGESRLAPCQI